MQTCAVVCTEQPTCSKAVDDQDFPALVKFGSQHDEHKSQNSNSLPAYHPARTTEIIEIPYDQRRFQSDDQNSLGKRYDAQKRICMEIVKETGVEISLNNSKSNLLTVVLSGPPSKVSIAKRCIIAELQQEETTKLHVPQEFHGYLIGKKGERLRSLQASTMTRINIPPSNSPDPNTITIAGPKQGLLEAEQTIKDIVEKQAQQGFERLDIPKIYHPFICGPNNQQIDELRALTDTKINMPPPGGQGTVITISGKRDGVLQVAAKIQAIYDQAKLSKTMPVRVKRSQHRLVFGPRGSGLAEILAETGVSVELPTDSISEELILRGRPEDLGRALTMVYERAESSIIETIPAPNRFHKLMIGKRGSALAEILEGYDKVHIEFGDNQDKILVEGPPEEVSVVVERLKARIAELETTVAFAVVRVDPKYFRHIIGKNGSTVLRLCEHNVQIRLPTLERGSSVAADEIIIEGDPTGVEKAKSEIQQMVEKLENEKCKDVIIEPRIQSLLRTGYKGTPPPIRIIYDLFPKVSMVWPDVRFDEFDSRTNQDNPSKSVVQLRGDRQQVDAAAERLSKLIKQLIEENFRQEIRIFKEFRPHIFGKGSTKIQKLLDDSKTRIQYPSPSDSSDVFTIIGREQNVQQAIRQLEEMQKKLANIKEVIVSIPSALTTKFVGDQAPSLRSICEQCPGVHIRFLHTRQKNIRSASQVEVVLLGPQEALDKAQKLITQLNDEVSQLCAEELVHVEAKFHGFLIGRLGANITRFRERHNVELLFPDRMETDSKLSMEIRIVGPKESIIKAREELESLIKTLEDEVEHSVPVDPNHLRDVMTYRREFSYPDLERVRLIMPKTISRTSTDDTPSPSESVAIKLIGQKACVEAAAQALQSLIEDIEEQTTKEFPLSDPNQFVALDRARSQFRELQRSYRVFINLRRSVADIPPPESSQPPAFALSGCLFVTGRPEQCDLLFEEEIKPMLPVEQEFALNKEFHRSLISVPVVERERQRRSGAPPVKTKQPTPSTNEEPAATESQSKAAELKQKHGIFIRLPPQQAMDANHIFLRGTPAQLSAAKPELEEWVQQCEQIKADRIARSFELSVQVPTRFIQSVIAARPKLTATHDVNLRFVSDAPQATSVQQPSTVNGAADHDSADDEEAKLVSKENEEERVKSTSSPVQEQMSTVIFRGHKEKTEAAKQELETLVNKLRAQVPENLYIPSEVHPHLIGSRGHAIQKVMQQFKVRIEFPGRNAPDASNVVVIGDQVDVDRACDYLIAKANDLIDRLDSDNRTSKPKQYREELIPSQPGSHLKT